MRKPLIIVLIAIFVLVPLTSCFKVDEGQRGIIMRFGKVLRDSKNDHAILYKPGLNLKVPFFDSVKLIDARIQTMNNGVDRFVTKEKKDLIVDSYVHWKVNNFGRYYVTTGNGDTGQAENILSRKFSDRLRSKIGKLHLKEVVTCSRGDLTVDVLNSLNDGGNTSEENITKFGKSLSSMATLGIKVMDVRIKKINLPSEVSDAIYKRMRAERESVARSQRSKGREQAEKVRALADYRVTRLLAESQRKALIIQGEADAQAAKLFAHAFNKDRDFYKFYRSLRAYGKAFNGKNDVMLLSARSDFFRFMKSPHKSMSRK
jgi:membrane protease subunit HflC